MTQHFQLASTTNDCQGSASSISNLLIERTLIIASNRGPVTLRQSESGNLEFQRGSGGLITALAGVIQHAEARWIAWARTLEDKALRQGSVPLNESGEMVWMQFLTPHDASCEGYYRVIANPLLV